MFSDELSLRVFKRIGFALFLISASVSAKETALHPQGNDWQVLQGDWAFQQDSILGTGEGFISSAYTLTPPYTLQLKFRIREQGKGFRVLFRDGAQQKAWYIGEPDPLKFGVSELEAAKLTLRQHLWHDLTLQVGTAEVRGMINDTVIWQKPWKDIGDEPYFFTPGSVGLGVWKSRMDFKQIKISSSHPTASVYTEPAAHTLSSLAVMSFNIHHGRGRDKIYNVQRISDFISEHQVSIAGLQEVDKGKSRSRFENQAKIFMEELGHTSFYGNTLGATYGNLTLSRYPIVDTKKYYLPTLGNEPRRFNISILNINGRYINFINTHIANGNHPRKLKQLGIIAEHLKTAQFKNPIIMTADFNTSDLDAFLEGTGLISVRRNLELQQGIDDILISEELLPLLRGGKVIQNTISDHPAVWAKLDIEQLRPLANQDVLSSTANELIGESDYEEHVQKLEPYFQAMDGAYQGLFSKAFNEGALLPALGGQGGTGFQHQLKESGYLIGLKTYVGEYINGVIGIYLTPTGFIHSKLYGKAVGELNESLAPPGYLLTGLKVNAVRFVNGVQPLFTECKRGIPDFRSTTAGDWMGRADESATVLQGSPFIVGFHGRCMQWLDSLGVITGGDVAERH